MGVPFDELVAPKRKVYPSSVTREGKCPLARIPGQLWCSQAHWACHAEAAADLAAQSGMTVKARCHPADHLSGGGGSGPDRVRRALQKQQAP